MKVHTWPAVVVTGVMLAVVSAAAPASAAFAPMLADVDVHTTTTGHSAVSECFLHAGYTTDPRFITYVVRAETVAGGASVAIATSVQCTVYDPRDPSRTYGGASGATPGPYAVAVGQAIVPVGVIPTACVRGGATFLDGTTIASTKPCP